MRKFHVHALFTLCVFMFSSSAFAEQRIDIVQIMGQFVQASYAVSRCEKPDQDTLSNFLNNFKGISKNTI